MTRLNRLKKILDAIGIVVSRPYSSIDKKRLNALHINAHRFADILHNRPSKDDLTIAEIDSLCEWLGITHDDLMVPKGMEHVDEYIKVRLRTEVHIKDRPKKKPLKDPNQRTLPINV